jgi:hypothetical protein
MPFNGGKPYHGSEEISEARLTGRTGRTDYFFFLCPKCNDGTVLRVLEYERRLIERPLSDRGERAKPSEHLNLAFHLHCPTCQFDDFIKIDNDHPGGQAASVPLFGS